MNHNPLGINSSKSFKSTPGSLFAALVLLFLGTVAGRATQQQVVFQITNQIIQNGSTVSGSSAALLPPAYAYAYQITGTCHATGNLAVLITGTESIQEAIDKLQGNFYEQYLEGTVVNPPGTLPFTVVDKTASGSFAGGFASGSAEFLVQVDATGRASFLVDNVSFEVFGSPDGSQLIIDSATVTTTAVLSPVAVTGTATTVTGSSAILNGSVNPNGDNATVTFDYGQTTSYGSTTAAQIIPQGLAPAAVSVPITGLQPSKLYHFRVSGSNSTGLTSGTDQTFTTLAAGLGAPTASTGTASNITTASATLNGAVSPGGLATTVTFEYGLDTNYGMIATAGSIGSGTSVVPVAADISGLISGTTYHFRVTGSNAISSVDGNDVTFNTAAIIPPTVVTGSATPYNVESAYLNGTVNPNGFATTAMFEFGTDTTYGTTTTGFSVGSGTAALPVTQQIGVTSGSTYHFRLDAVTASGTTFGADSVYVAPQAGTLSVVTGTATSVGTTYATIVGTVNTGGLEAQVNFEYGLTGTYGFSTTPFVIQNPTFAPDPVGETIGGLTPGTTYHFRVDAVGGGVGAQPVLGNDMTFTTATSGSAPTATTGTAGTITASTAIVNGLVNPNGVDTSVIFQYGTTSSYTTTTIAQDIGSGTDPVAVNAQIIGLKPSTLYHFQVTGSNSEGITPGGDQTFMTGATIPPPAPTVITDSATVTGTSTAVLNGSVNPNGTDTSAYFAYGLDTNYGSQTLAMPIGSGSMAVLTTGSLTGLQPGTTYHFKAVGASTAGTVSGSDQTLTTAFVFGPYSGKYAAAFAGAEFDTSGMGTVTVTSNGSFTVSVKAAGKSFSGSGKFTSNGSATVNHLGVTLQLQLENAGGHNSVDVTATVPVIGMLSFNAMELDTSKRLAAAYTVRLPHPVDQSLPQGNGYGTLTVGKTGAIRVTGKLGDGSTFTASGGLLKDSTFPFYAQVYSKKGAVVGTLTFESTANGDLDGPLAWFKPATTGTFTPAAFPDAGALVNLYGSTYVKPAKGTAVITATTGSTFDLQFSDGNLATSPLTDSVTLTTANKFTFPAVPADKLKITITTSNGLFSGSFEDLTAKKTRKFNGAVFQGLNIGTGVFKGATEAGSVDLFTAPPAPGS